MEFMESYLQTGSALMKILSHNQNAYETIRYAEESFVRETNDYKAGADSIVVCYFALISMAAMFGSCRGKVEVENVQADLTPQGARMNMVPVHKLKIFTYSMITTILIQFISLLLLVAFMALVLGIDFGVRLLPVLVTCFFAGIMGVSFGAMVASLVRGSEGIRMGIMISVSIILSAAAGMVYPDLKHIVTQAAPAAAYLNPDQPYLRCVLFPALLRRQPAVFPRTTRCSSHCPFCSPLSSISLQGGVSMPVFNAYFKVIKKNLASILIYFFVFMALALMFLNLFGAGRPNALFSATKTNMVFFSGEDSPLVSGLKQSLEKTANIVPMDDDAESIQDALFHNKIAYVLRVPAGFTEDFISRRDEIPLKKTSRPMDPGAVSVDLMVDKYLNIARLYLQNVPGIKAQEVADNVLGDLGVSVNVEMKGSRAKSDAGLAECFRYLPYPILSIILMGITTVMMSFNTTEIQRRNMCAPLSPSRLSLQLFLANTVFAAARLDRPVCRPRRDL
jgi:hypothetical protein